MTMVLDVLFSIIGIVVTIWSYVWWKKYGHCDYLWLTVVWCIFAINNAIDDLLYTFVFSELTYENMPFYLFHSVVNWAILLTASFYFAAIVGYKWNGGWGPRKELILALLMSRIGVLVIVACALCLAAIFVLKGYVLIPGIV